MRLRLLVTSLLIGMVTVAPTWLSLQPLLGPGPGAAGRVAAR